MLGKKCILKTDHKPLLAIFGEKKGIPVMAFGKLQRWAMFLSGFDYNIVYVKRNENGAADGLSRLPLKMKEEDLGEEYLKFVERACPIDACIIRVETKKDKLLSAVLSFINGDTYQC
jgi:hypothetical protein